MRHASGIILASPQILVTTASLLCFGVAMACTIPYQSILGVRELGINNSSFAAMMFGAATVNVVAAVLLGNLSDMVANRKVLVLVLGALGVAGYGVIYALPTQAVFLISMLTLVPVARSAFGVLFGGIRREIDHLAPVSVQSVNSTVRATYNMSWVVVPGLVGWWLLSANSVAPAFLVASVSTLAGLLIFAFLAQPGDALPPPHIGFVAALKEICTGPMMLRVAVLALGSGAHALHNTLHPLVMTGPAHGTMRDVGIYAGLLALFEIPFMLLWSWVAQRRSVYFAMSAALAVYAVYGVLLAFATAPWHLYAIGILNCCGVAAILALPMSAFQDLIRERPGLATSLSQVMAFAGSILAAGGFALGTFLASYAGAAIALTVMCIAGSIGCITLHKQTY